MIDKKTGKIGCERCGYIFVSTKLKKNGEFPVECPRCKSRAYLKLKKVIVPNLFCEKCQANIHSRLYEEKKELPVKCSRCQGKKIKVLSLEIKN